MYIYTYGGVFFNSAPNIYICIYIYIYVCANRYRRIGDTVGDIMMVN